MELVGVIDVPDEPAPCAVRRHLREPVGGESRAREELIEIQRENILTVFVNDIPTMQMGCSASHLAELVCGRLFTEGLVSGIDEIDCLSVCEKSMRADVYICDRSADLSRKAARRVDTCCANNVMLNDFFGKGEPPAPVQPIEWTPDWVFRVADVFALDRTSHSRTFGTHSAYLANCDDVLYLREDIGRHNAFDKVVGSALIDGVDLTHCLLFTSGRVPTDMTVKAVRAGIPLLVSKAVATDKTIDMARAFGLTLICNAHPDSFDLVCAPAR